MIFRFSILVFILISTSCGSEENCTPDSISGTYTGNNTCDQSEILGVSLNVGEITYAITHQGGDRYTATDQNNQATMFTLDNCDLTIPIVDFDFGGLLLSSSGEGNIDGDQIIINTITTGDGISGNCSFVGTKQ